MEPIYAQLGGTIALTFAIAACVPAPRAAPPVQTRPSQPPVAAPLPPPPPADWQDAPQTPGDWRYRRVEGGTFAEFGGGAASPAFGLGCMSNSRQVVLIRHGAQAAASTAMTVRAETASRTLPTTRATGQQGTSAALSATDPLLDAMALSKGRFAVEVAGSPPLYLPSWAEVSRVIEDCR